MAWGNMEPHETEAEKSGKKFQGKEVHTMIRLNKYMSEAGVCSRREADRLIEAGKVTVDGMKATSACRLRKGRRCG